MQKASMELSVDERKKEVACCPEGAPVRKYGYGLQLYLDKDQLAKLGITKALPVGTIVKVEASAIVESVSERAEIKRNKDDDGRDIHLNLQITELGLEPEGTAPHPSELLYTNS